jgi:hypothetical protein
VKARTSCGWRRCVDGSRDLGALPSGSRRLCLSRYCLSVSSQAIDLMKPAHIGRVAKRTLERVVEPLRLSGEQRAWIRVTARRPWHRPCERQLRPPKLRRRPSHRQCLGADCQLRTTVNVGAPDELARRRGGADRRRSRSILSGCRAGKELAACQPTRRPPRRPSRLHWIDKTIPARLSSSAATCHRRSRRAPLLMQGN